MLKVRRITAIDELRSIREDWIRLADSRHLSVFQSWEWNISWCEEVLPCIPQARPDVRVAESDSGRIVGILPVYICRLVPGIGQIRFFGSDASFSNDALVDPTDEEALRAIFDDIRIMRFNNIVHLKHLCQDSPLTALFANRKLTRYHCPRLILEQDDKLENQLQRLSRSSRKSLRNRRNRLERDHDVSVRSYVSSQASEPIERLFELHADRFATRKKQSLLSKSHMRFLKAAYCRLAERDACRIIELRADDRAISSELILSHGSRCYLIQAGFDPEFGTYSPGWLSTCEALTYVFEQSGFDSCDFGPGYEDYKYRWSPIEKSNYFVCRGQQMSPGSMLARLYATGWQRRLPRIAARAGR